VQRGLFGKEAPNLLGRESGDINGVAIEALRLQPSYEPQHHGPRLRRESAHVVHVFVVAAQFLSAGLVLTGGGAMAP